MPVSVWIAALLGAAATWIQLRISFRERRPFEARKTTVLFVLIGVFAGAIAGAVAWVPLLPVVGEIAGVTLGVGTSIPLARVPGSSPLRTRNSRAGAEITKVLNDLWEIAAFMTTRLNGMLAAAKERRVNDVVREINLLYSREDYPPYERVGSALKWLIENHVGKDRETYKGRLADAYRESEKNPEPLKQLISLAYDINQEGEVLDQVREDAHLDSGPIPPDP